MSGNSLIMNLTSNIDRCREQKLKPVEIKMAPSTYDLLKKELSQISSTPIERVKDFRGIPIIMLMNAGTPWTRTEYEIVCEQEEPTLFGAKIQKVENAEPHLIGEYFSVEDGKLRITFARISKPSPAVAGPQHEPGKQA